LLVLFNIAPLYFWAMDNPKRIPFLVRLHKDSRELLTKAAEDQRRSVSSIIDQCVRDQLQARYSELQPRLQRFLSGVKQP
jgi:hypothetical protein